MEQPDSKTNLPPSTLSVAIPALPSTYRQDVAEVAIELVCIGVLALSVFTWFSIDRFDGKWTAMAVFVVILACLVYVSTWRQRKTLAKRREFEQKLHDMAMELSDKNAALKQLIQIDPLTQLLNRRGLEKALSVELSRARRRGSALFVVLLDCDDFKSVNESFGHAVGDLVLTSMAKNIMRSIRPTDYASRIGGDEFVILLADLDAENAAKVAERIRVTITDYPVLHAEKAISCTASLGVAQLPLEMCSIEEVLSLTRMTLQSSKAHGKNRITLSGMKISDEDGSDKARMELNRLVRNITSGQDLRTVWQPIVKLAGGATIGYEALVRGPEGPFEAPAELFKLAQEHNVLTSVDMKCLKGALTYLDKVPPGMRYHVNLFPATLLDIPVESIPALLAPLNNDVKLCIELSEQQFLGGPECLMVHVQALKSRGVQIALDDVGLVRSSLESLIVLEPHIVKIHEKLTRGIATSGTLQKHVRHMLEIAKVINAEIIAEGIETKEDLYALKQIGVGMGQGFVLGKPQVPSSCTRSENASAAAS